MHTLRIARVAARQLHLAEDDFLELDPVAHVPSQNTLAEKEAEFALLEATNVAMYVAMLPDERWIPDRGSMCVLFRHAGLNRHRLCSADSLNALVYAGMVVATRAAHSRSFVQWRDRSRAYMIAFSSAQEAALFVDCLVSVGAVRAAKRRRPPTAAAAAKAGFNTLRVLDSIVGEARQLLDEELHPLDELISDVALLMEGDTCDEVALNHEAMEREESGEEAEESNAAVAEEPQAACVSEADAPPVPPPPKMVATSESVSAVEVEKSGVPESEPPLPPAAPPAAAPHSPPKLDKRARLPPPPPPPPPTPPPSEPCADAARDVEVLLAEVATSSDTESAETSEQLVRLPSARNLLADGTAATPRAQRAESEAMPNAEIERMVKRLTQGVPHKPPPPPPPVPAALSPAPALPSKPGAGPAPAKKKEEVKKAINSALASWMDSSQMTLRRVITLSTRSDAPQRSASALRSMVRLDAEQVAPFATTRGGGLAGDESDEESSEFVDIDLCGTRWSQDGGPAPRRLAEEEDEEEDESDDGGGESTVDDDERRALQELQFFKQK